MGPKIRQKRGKRVATAVPKVSKTTSQPRTRGGASRKRGGGGVSREYAYHLRKQEVYSQMKTRQLQLASGGRYKYFLLAKIVSYLKEEFLEAKEKRLTVQQLLVSVKEPDVSEEVQTWLEDEALPDHSRIRVVELRSSVEKRFAYEPPLRKLKLEEDLLQLLKSMYYSDEGGLLQKKVEDSMPLAGHFIKKLLEKSKIIQVTRFDKEHVLFYKKPDPFEDQLALDGKFVNLWHKVNVSNKEMHQMKTYLKNKRLAVIDDEEFDNEDKQDIFQKDTD